MKRVSVFLSFFFIFFFEIHAQEFSQKKVPFGLQGQLLMHNGYGNRAARINQKVNKIFFSYSIGIISEYKFSDTSKIKLGLGVLFPKPYFYDGRELRCDNYCPPLTIRSFYIEFPIWLKYYVYTNKKKNYQLFVQTGPVLNLLVSESIKYYKYQNGELIADTSVIHHIFKGYNKSIGAPVNALLMFGLGNDIKINQKNIGIGIQIQLITRRNGIIFNSLGLVTSVLF